MTFATTAARCCSVRTACSRVNPQDLAEQGVEVLAARWWGSRSGPPSPSPRYNFGWSVFEGRHRFRPGRAPRHLPPVIEHRHRSGFCAIVGGFVGRDPALPRLRGRYIYGDFCRSQLEVTSLRKGRSRPLGAVGQARSITAGGRSLPRWRSPRESMHDSPLQDDLRLQGPAHGPRELRLRPPAKLFRPRRSPAFAPRELGRRSSEGCKVRACVQPASHLP